MFHTETMMIQFEMPVSYCISESYKTFYQVFLSIGYILRHSVKVDGWFNISADVSSALAFLNSIVLSYFYTSPEQTS